MRRGPSRTPGSRSERSRSECSRSKWTSLSPPSPTVCTATASTMVRQPPTSAPSRRSSGKPSRSKAMSVVVPPMSATMTSRSPLRWCAPMALAAGPDSTVSIGRCSAVSAEISEPSPLTTISGAAMPSSPRRSRTARISCCNKGMRRAFNRVVKARRGASRLELSSCPQVTGRSVSVRSRSRRAISCAGLRTAKCPATAKAETLSACSAMAARAAARSSGRCASPCGLWPPSMKTTGSSPRAWRRPARSSAPSSKPISIRQARRPCPSTTALVARVVETETSPTSATASAPLSARTARTAWPMPSARSCLVVSALAEASTPAASSYSTASV